MTDRCFPVAGTKLMIPWEVAEHAYRGWVRLQISKYPPDMDLRTGLLTMRQLFRMGVTANELDTWAPGWRDEATAD